MKICSLIFISLLLSLSVFSQENNNLTTNLQHKNTVDLTLGGTGLFISANYSRILAIKPNYFINTSVGVGTVPFIGGTSFSHQLTLNYGKKTSFLELGMGGSFWTGKTNASAYTETVNSYYISPIIGWRKNFKNNLVFRVYTNPLVHISGEYYIENNSVVPYLGLSLGYSF